MSNSADRLIAYSKALMGDKVLCANQNETIERMYTNLSEESRISLEENISRQDAMYKRVFAYAQKFAEMKGNEEFKRSLEDIILAYENYDYSKEGRVSVNGNTFTYKKDEFIPDNYMDELAKIGESVQGEIFAAYINEEGELVVY